MQRGLRPRRAAQRMSRRPMLFEFAIGNRLDFGPTGGAHELFRYVPGDVDEATAALVEPCQAFCFPDAELFAAASTTDWLAVERYSFVLTTALGGRFFGFVQRQMIATDDSSAPAAYRCCHAFAVGSMLPCHALFAPMLDEIAARFRSEDDAAVATELCARFLDRVRSCQVPGAGQAFVAPFFKSDFLNRWRFVRPDEHDTPLVYTDYQPLLRRFKPKRLVRLLCSLLLERRFVFVARQLSCLSAVVQALLALLYPFAWHHTYIPVLPARMSAVCSAPMPFIVGLQPSTYAQLHADELEADVVIVDIEAGRVFSLADTAAAATDDDAAADDCSSNDVRLWPKHRLQPLHALFASLAAPLQPSIIHQMGSKIARQLTRRHDPSSTAATAEPVDLLPPKDATDALCCGMLKFYLDTIDGYRAFYSSSASQSSSANQTPDYQFNKGAFVDAAASDVQPFLRRFVETQMFEQFVATRAKRRHTDDPAHDPFGGPVDASATLAMSRFSTMESLGGDIAQVRRLLASRNTRLAHDTVVPSSPLPRQLVAVHLPSVRTTAAPLKHRPAPPPPSSDQPSSDQSSHSQSSSSSNSQSSVPTRPAPAAPVSNLFVPVPYHRPAPAPPGLLPVGLPVDERHPPPVRRFLKPTPRDAAKLPRVRSKSGEFRPFDGHAAATRAGSSDDDGLAVARVHRPPPNRPPPTRPTAT